MTDRLMATGTGWYFLASGDDWIGPFDDRDEAAMGSDDCDDAQAEYERELPEPVRGRTGKWPRLSKTEDGCWIAWIQYVAESEKYATQTGALGRLCEVLAGKLAEAKRTPFWPTGPCRCGGWGTPTGCPGCGIRCMGG